LLALSLFLCAVSASHYIVVFKKNVTDEQRENHVGRILQHVTANFSIGEDFRGFSAHLTPQQLKDEVACGVVEYIEEDGEVHASQTCSVQEGATWGINRISEKDISLEGDFKYSLDGSGVTAYVIDTGIRITHQEFSGRASWGKNFVNDGQDTDCNGHGTHVAGTIGGTVYGVAKKVTLVAVKVLGCSGSGTTAGVISGIQYACQQGTKPAVANMSLGGGFSKGINDAVAACVKAGVTFAVAAGNDGADACKYSPASEPTAITVGSTEVEDKSFDTQFDSRSSFSNFGDCVQVFAPGTQITAAWFKTDTSINTISGTSMASPHVAGAAAQFLGANPSATPKMVHDHLVGIANTDMIELDCGANAICKKSPNKLLYSPCS